jgi:1-acyl-sn-glycerol-3-phosphate acyltransferase
VSGQRRGFWLRLAAVILKPPLWVFTSPSYRGQKTIPPTGVIFVANHISYADPMVIARFVYDLPRYPRFLAKESLFHLPFAGIFLRRCGQIPVHRGVADASRALDSAVAAIGRGDSVIIYPEGTCTRDPDGWPMKGKTGAARLAFLTGAPVIPLAQWGSQRLHEPLSRKIRLVPRTPVVVVAGSAIDLSAYREGPLSAPALARATEAIMLRLREMVAEIRGVATPAGPLHARPGSARSTTPEVTS